MSICSLKAINTSGEIEQSLETSFNMNSYDALQQDFADFMNSCLDNLCCEHERLEAEVLFKRAVETFAKHSRRVVAAAGGTQVHKIKITIKIAKWLTIIIEL